MDLENKITDFTEGMVVGKKSTLFRIRSLMIDSFNKFVNLEYELCQNEHDFCNTEINQLIRINKKLKFIIKEAIEENKNLPNTLSKNTQH